MKIRLLEAKKDTKIEVENPGLLEVPEGKKVYDLPVSHFKKLIDKNGRAAVIRAINALQVWNKNDDPKIASWAKKMKKSLEGYGEKKENLKEKLDGKPVYVRLPKRALKGFKIGETVIMGRDYPEHWEITDYDDRTDEFILRNYEDEYQDEIAMQDINRREAEVDPIGHVGSYTGERNPYENESLKESSLTEEHTMVKEEIEELDDAIAEAIHQTNIILKTHDDKETQDLMGKVKRLLTKARFTY